jgi:hypothetical protein
MQIMPFMSNHSIDHKSYVFICVIQEPKKLKYLQGKVSAGCKGGWVEKIRDSRPLVGVSKGIFILCFYNVFSPSICLLVKFVLSSCNKQFGHL